MRRRDFLSMCGLAVAGWTLSPSKTLYVPGAIADPGLFTIDTATKTIKYVGGTGTYTVHEFYQWLQDQWDEPSMMSEETPIAHITPQVMNVRMENGWTIQDSAMQHLNNGSIEQVTERGEELWSSMASIGPVTPPEMSRRNFIRTLNDPR